MLMLRKDVKVGLIVGAAFLLIFLIYLAFGPSTPKTQANKNGPGAQLDEGVDPTPPADAAARRDPPPSPTRNDRVELSNTPAPSNTTTPPASPAGNDAGPRVDNAAVASNTATTPNPTPATPGTAGGEENDPWARALFRNEVPTNPSPIMTQLPPAPSAEERASSGANVGTDVATNGPTTGPSHADRTDRGHNVLPGDRTTPPQANRATGVASTHTVQAGETLSSIATAYFGAPGHYQAILDANPGINPNRLKIGQVINLPAADKVKPATPAGRGDTATAAKVTDPKTQYQIQTGDSLHKIAATLYGNSNLWIEIYNANKDAIGPDPAKLKLGMIITLPKAPNNVPTASVQ
jgi:nucleoid-associated protein YgaU